MNTNIATSPRTLALTPALTRSLPLARPSRACGSAPIPFAASQAAQVSHPMGEGEGDPAFGEKQCGSNVRVAAAEDGRTPVKKSPREISKRLGREWRTIETMVRIYCRDKHEGGLCPECKGLIDYASVRLDRCRFGADKPTCAKCPVHCYQKNRREQVKAVMRYAGPRMLWEHPILSLWHWVDGMRKRASLVIRA